MFLQQLIPFALLHQLTPIEMYALHYLEYLHVGDDESFVKVRSVIYDYVYVLFVDASN